MRQKKSYRGISKCLMAVILLAASTNLVKAQKEQGTVTLYPRIGFNMSKFQGDGIYFYDVDGSHKAEAKYRTGLTAGAEVQYQIATKYAVSAGLLYSNIGTKYDDLVSLNEDGKKETTKIEYSLNYLQLPIMLSGYAARNLAVRVGVQVGYLLDAKAKTDQYFYMEENGQTVYKHLPLSGDAKAAFRKFDFSVPIGVSYEYKNVVLDLRYVLGLTNDSKFVSYKNRSFVFTLGYGIDL